MNQSPAFQFYPADFLADENVALMSLAGRGAYITLICYCWREGSIPADMNRMGRLCGIDSSAMAQLWAELSACFTVEPASDSSAMNSYIANSDLAIRYIHPRLERERIKQQEHSKERQESGRKGANIRWQKGKRSYSSAIAKPIAEPIANHSSSSSSSSSCTSTNTSSVLVDGASRAKPRSARTPKPCDEEYLEELQKNPAYAVFDVTAVYHKMLAWCKQRQKQPTRARLLNWLNREDRPMVGNGAADKSEMFINPDELSPKTRGNAYAIQEFLEQRKNKP